MAGLIALGACFVVGVPFDQAIWVALIVWLFA